MVGNKVFEFTAVITEEDIHQHEKLMVNLKAYAFNVIVIILSVNAITVIIELALLCWSTLIHTFLNDPFKAPFNLIWIAYNNPIYFISFYLLGVIIAPVLTAWVIYEVYFLTKSLSTKNRVKTRLHITPLTGEEIIIRFDAIGLHFMAIENRITIKWSEIKGIDGDMHFFSLRQKKQHSAIPAYQMNDRQKQGEMFLFVVENLKYKAR